MQIPVTRPLFYNGMVYAAGGTIDVTALGAADAIASGRAVLADPVDAERVQAAVTEQGERLMHKLNVAEQQAAASWVLRRQRA
jgi:2,4-dienoyl-CoA reductase-like NADH-dependent reductase (Old Yellow Enzyme family)